jgi:hypothetical protein
MKHSTNPAGVLKSVLAVIAACVLECSSGLAPAADTDPDKVDPCKLITQAEAQSALGMPVKPGQFMESMIYRFCSFRAVKGGPPYVSVRLFSTDKASFYVIDPAQSERATGTNLDAYFSKNYPVLSVWHAGNSLQIDVHFDDSTGTAGVKAAELKLAAIAVTRF